MEQRGGKLERHARARAPWIYRGTNRQDLERESAEGLGRGRKGRGVHAEQQRTMTPIFRLSCPLSHGVQVSFQPFVHVGVRYWVALHLPLMTAHSVFLTRCQMRLNPRALRVYTTAVLLACALASPA